MSGLRALHRTRCAISPSSSSLSSSSPLFPSLSMAFRNAHNAIRSNSTTTTTTPSSASSSQERGEGVGIVGPESPAYIEIPMPATRVPPWKLPKKGFVPKPRNVLKNSSNRLPKHSPEFLELVAPEPKHPKTLPPDTYGQEKMKYKDQLSATRRKNLREGIVELHEKQLAEREKRREISERRQRERDEILAKEQSNDLKYTLPTVDKHLNESFRPVDRYASRHLAYRKARFMRLVKKHRQVKVDQLHGLYQNAASFILTEAQLDEVILKKFAPNLDIHNNVNPPDLDDLLRVKVEQGFSPKNKPAAANKELEAALTGGQFPLPYYAGDEDDSYNRRKPVPLPWEQGGQI